MADPRWGDLDLRARQVKRATVAETRRGVKLAQERVRNAGTAAVNLARKAWRRAVAAPERIRQRLRRLDRTRKIADTYRVEWAIEREIARAVSGTGPIVVGPWLSEVGYEVLYWLPFLRWVQKRYDVDPARCIAVSRGGAAAWYAGLAADSVEVFDILDPAAFAQKNARRGAEGAGTLKQFVVSAMDLEILDDVKRRKGLDAPRVLHPSLLYRLFHQFWLGHRPQGFYDSHTRQARVPAPPVALPPDLPERYVAVKFYTAMSLPDTPAVRRTLESIVLALAERTHVVVLDTGLTFDDHSDHAIDGASRIHTLRGRLDPRDNLAVQTAIIARAEAFVGTCGAVAWLAPMLGIDTTAVMADPRFLHHHLQVARRVYQGIDGAGRFSVLDIGAFEQLGLAPELRSSLSGPIA